MKYYYLLLFFLMILVTPHKPISDWFITENEEKYSSKTDLYPKDWLNDIKNKGHETLEDVFMLKLYELYVYKNGKDTKNNLDELIDMKKKLNYKTIDIVVLFDFLNKNNYTIKKIKNVKSYVANKTEQGGDKIVYKYNDRYFYLYKYKDQYDKNIKIYDILKDYNFIPKILYKNDESLVMEVENTGNILNINDNIDNLKDKIYHIHNVLKEKNILHKDITLHNITHKDGNIYLIDFDNSELDANVKEDFYSYHNFKCQTLPLASNDNVNDYINENYCLKWWI